MQQDLKVQKQGKKGAALMRYSDEVIEEVRARNDVVDVIGGYIHLQKKGSNYFGLCPFHNEKSPSFSVSPQKQMYYCFGCGKGGNVITFVMDYENESFQEAVASLAERAGIELPQEEESEESRRQADYRSILFAIQKEAARYFYHQLMSENGKRGYLYLRGRGLSDETIKNFGLGYANQYPDDLYRFLRQKGFSDAQLKDSGLVKIDERGCYDKFWNRVMFPIMDINNKVIGFGGRVMGEGEPKYLNSPETPIFEKNRNLYGMHVAKRNRKPYFLICEGYMDVISLHQAGFTNAVASLGTAFTVQHGLLLKRYTKEVVLTFDSDGAGIKAALRAIPILKEAGLSARVLTMKPYKDPDEFIKNMGAEAYQKRIDEAIPSFMFEIQVLRDGYDFSDPSKKTEFFEEAANKLRTFEDVLERNNYIEAVSRTYGIDYQILKQKVEEHAYKAPQAMQKERKQVQKKREKDEGLKAAQRLLLTWLSDHPGQLNQLADIIMPEDFSDSLYQEVARLLYKQIEQGKGNPAELLTNFIEDESQYQEVAKIFNGELVQETSGSEKTRGIRECVIRLKRHSLQKEADTTDDIKRLQEVMEALKGLDHLNISF